MPSFDLENFLPFKLSIASQSISGLIANEYEARFGLTMTQWRVLVIVSNHAPLSASDICARTLIDKMSVSRSLRALSTRALIHSTSASHDGRKRMITLSQTGQKIYNEVIPIAKKYENKVLQMLSDSQRHTFNAILDILIQGSREL